MQITSASRTSPVHTPRRTQTPEQPALDTLAPARDAENVEAALRQLMAGPTKGASESRQFADSYGRVKNLALMISEKYMTPEMRSQVLDAYQTLFTRMEPDTKFTIVAATDRDRADVEALRAQAPNPERIQILEPGLEDLTVWARDMMVPKFFPDNPGQTAIMAQEPLHNWHLSDSKIPAMICDANSTIKLEPHSVLVTDGGDVQANTKESFTGYYSLAATENKLHEALKDKPFKQEVINFYEQRTGNHVVETPFNQTFPFRFVPAVALDGTHITRMEENPDFQTPSLAQNEVSDAQMYDDLTVSLFTKALNRPVTVMGRDNPATEHVEEPATDHMDMGMTPIDDKTFLVGDPRLARELLGLPADSRNRDNSEDFDAYAQTLESKGYKVVRVPHMEPKVNGDPYLTYNNCLMERFEKDGQEVRRVFLPIHGVQATDDFAIKTWEGQGFEVIPMRLDKLSCDWGALRCISNWLDRSPTA